MSPKHLYIVGGIVALAVVLGLVGGAYVSAKLATVRADQVREDMKPVHEKASDDKQQASKAEDVNQKALLATLAAIAAQKNQPIQTQVDYDRIAEMIESRMGVKAEIKPTELPNAPSATLPAKQLRDYISDCDSVTAEYGSCKQTVSNVEKQLVAEKADHQATKAELVAERKARKGTFWGRLKSNAQWLVVGGVVGGAAICGTGHCR